MDMLTMWKKRLESWRDEKETNRNGMAYLADRAIRLLEAQIEVMECASGSASPQQPQERHCGHVAPYFEDADGVRRCGICQQILD